MKLNWIPLFLGIALIACKENTNTAVESHVSEETIAKHIETLASDDFLGRKPFTEGETKTLEYLNQEIKRIGLAPGNGDAYTQDVPLVEITGMTSETMQLNGDNPITLELGKDYSAYTERAVESIEIKGSELVFCGYGIVAPEYNWNDFEGIDVKGKTIIVLVNDPGLGSEDSTFFKGSTMTYYGRWTYKYEEAARQGAAGVLVMHETSMAGYPWAVIGGAGKGAKLNLKSNPEDHCEMVGWVSLDATKAIFEKAGLDLRTAMHDARKPGFKAIPLPYTVDLTIQNTIKENASKNVIATIPGTDQKDEYIIFSAHWDHLGVGAVVDGDSIYNGAVDNGTGSASLLAIAESMMKAGPYKRTVVFLWVTAEEQGLLGSAYYAAHPIYPPAKTVANMNIDGMATYGQMKDFSIVGYGQNELEDYAAKYAAQQDRYILPDQEAEKGYFFRSDHFNFAKVGIPALYGEGSYDHREKGIEYAKEKSSEYRTQRYHLPSDEYDASTFDLGGIVQDCDLYMSIAQELANSQDWPKWRDGSEFKAARDASLNE